MKRFLLLIAIGLLQASYCFALDTGFKAPTVSVSGTWALPDNVFTSNDLYAVAAGGQTEVYGTFNFPNLANVISIDGIEAQMEAQATDGVGDPVTMKVSLSWDGGTTFTTVKTNTFPDGADQVDTFGGATDTWGRTWSGSEFSNANFMIKGQPATTPTGAAIDFIQVKVYYTGAGPGIRTQGVYWGGVGTR